MGKNANEEISGSGADTGAGQLEENANRPATQLQDSLDGVVEDEVLSAEGLPESGTLAHDEIRRELQTLRQAIINLSERFDYFSALRVHEVAADGKQTTKKTQSSLQDTLQKFFSLYFVTPDKATPDKKNKNRIENLQQDLSSVKEQLSSLQEKNEQIVNRMREIDEINRTCNLELVEAFKAQLAKAVWEHVFSTEKYSSNIIEKIGCNDEGFEKLKEAGRASNKELREMLAQDFGTTCFQDPDGSPIVNRRHLVVHWLTNTDQGQTEPTIAQTHRDGVKDANEKILYPQLVSAYHYRTPAEESESSQDANTTK